MRVLVTGGCGLVGSMAVRLLLEQGHEPVAYDIAIKTELLDDVKDQVTFVRGDILDVPDLMRAVADNDAQRILHAASFLSPAAYERPYAAVRTNILGALNVFETVRNLGLERAVFTSSGKSVSDIPKFGQNANAGNFGLAADPYSSSKIASELLLSDWRQLYDLDLVIVRFAGLVYGPGYEFSGVVGQALKGVVEAAVRGEPAELPAMSGRTAVTSMLYARDAADGAVRATLIDNLPDWVYNLHGHDTHSVAEVANIIAELIPGADIKVPPIEAKGQRIEPDQRTKAHLGYEAQYDVTYGLGEYIDFLKTKRLRDWKV
jgi:UDP-glucose 4-epimerase